MALHVRDAVALAGGVGRCDIASVNHHLRRPRYNRGGYVYPIDLVAERIKLARSSPPLVDAL